MNQTRRVAVKIALDGYEDYRATVAKLNNANKLFASELGVLNKQLAANSTDMNALKEKHEVLKKAFDNQREAVGRMADALKIAKDRRLQKCLKNIKTPGLKNFISSSLLRTKLFP